MMAKKTYSFYPGCSSQTKASSDNYLKSDQLDVQIARHQLNEIPDWNCCGASIGYAEGGELPRITLSARNIALSEQHNPGQDIVATCAACWLATREAKERLRSQRAACWPKPTTALQGGRPELSRQAACGTPHGGSADRRHRLTKH